MMCFYAILVKHDSLISVTLIREINLISRNQLSLAKSTYKIKILWQMYIIIALFSSKKVKSTFIGEINSIKLQI